MLVDILSDTHFDSHFKHLEPNDEMLVSMWRTLKPQGDTLVIAGDIGHNNWQNINILKALRRNFYKNIVLVLGNHDYYLRKGVVKYYHGENGLITDIPTFETSKERVDEFKNLCKEIEGVHLLDGDMVEIDGVKFGGAMGWYDGKYYLHNKEIAKTQNRPAYDRRVNLQALWKDSMDDDIYIKPKMKFDGFLRAETEKIERVLAQEPDVMITHINPSTKLEHQNKPFIKYISTSFFCYDGRRHMDAFNGKYWIFGHSHFSNEFDIDCRFKLMTNCLGYTNEKNRGKIKTIDTREAVCVGEKYGHKVYRAGRTYPMVRALELDRDKTLCIAMGTLRIDGKDEAGVYIHDLPYIIKK